MAVWGSDVMLEGGSVSVVGEEESLWVVKIAHPKDYPGHAPLPCQEESHANTIAIQENSAHLIVMKKGNGRLLFLIMVGYAIWAKVPLKILKCWIYHLNWKNLVFLKALKNWEDKKELPGSNLWSSGNLEWCIKH